MSKDAKDLVAKRAVVAVVALKAALHPLQLPLVMLLTHSSLDMTKSKRREKTQPEPPKKSEQLSKNLKTLKPE